MDRLVVGDKVKFTHREYDDWLSPVENEPLCVIEVFGNGQMGWAKAANGTEIAVSALDVEYAET